MAQATRKYLCIPASSATPERSFSKLKAHSWSKTGNIVRRAREGALVFVLEPRLDVLGSILLKYVRKLNYLVCGEFVKKCNTILFFKSILVVLDFVGSFGSMLTEWICCTLFCIFCALNGAMCCSYCTQKSAMVLHSVKVQHNVQELAYQYFIFISLSATVLCNTVYSSVGK